MKRIIITIIIGLLLGGNIAQTAVHNMTDSRVYKDVSYSHEVKYIPVQIEADIEETSTELQEDFNDECAFYGLTFYDVPLSEYMQEYVYRVAGCYGIEYKLVMAVIGAESSYQFIEGDNGRAIGYMQVQPEWWQHYMDISTANPYTEEGNIRLGCMILADCLYDNDFNYKRALKQYNQWDPDYPTDEYYEMVMDWYNNKLKEKLHD